MGAFISGFMIVREAERQGYPFVEAVRAALAVCDELLVSDGYSSDRTWEGLLALREAFPGRVDLFRDRWPDTHNRGACSPTRRTSYGAAAAGSTASACRRTRSSTPPPPGS